MAGVYAPLLPMAHQYLVTDDIPEIVAFLDRGKEFPHVMDPGGESYLRQEGRGICIGFYEKPCEPWSVDRTPWDFGHELLHEDWPRSRTRSPSPPPASRSSAAPASSA
jgi:dimethylglycine dehydrogenase